MIILTNKYKPKVSIRELERGKASELMYSRGLSERGLQQEIRNHCGDCSSNEQRKVYDSVYSTNKK